MRITEEIDITVDNEIYSGNCMFINLDEYPEDIDEWVMTIRKVMIDDQIIDCFIINGTVEDSYGNKYEQINLYLLKDISESCLGKVISFLES